MLAQIDYDIQNMELCCGEFNDSKKLIFNTKLNCATSVYIREYSDIISFNNVMYGLYVSQTSSKFIQYNYLTVNLEDECDFLSPMIVEFVVNPAPSVVKVFDTQELVRPKKEWDSEECETYFGNNTRNISFETDLANALLQNSDSETVITNREGNIRYAIPRVLDDEGNVINRLRGKWMTERFENEVPTKEDSISHIITKFRQSYT